MAKKTVKIVFVWFFVLNLLKVSAAVTFEEFVTLTYSEKVKLDKFRENVSKRLPQSYMKEDVYLIRWLRAKDFNLDEAERFLMQNIKWRSENRMDNILFEDWSEYERDYQFVVEGCDKTGIPVISVDFGSWDMRQSVITGQREKLMRYIDKLAEEANSIIRFAQSIGRNVTQYTLVLDLGDYNLIQQGCPACIPIFIYMATSYQAHYPEGIHKFIVVNTPAIFQTTLTMLMPIVSQRTKQKLVVFGRNKKEWKSYLLQASDPDQLTKRYGGTKEFGFEIEDFRKNRELPC